MKKKNRQKLSREEVIALYNTYVPVITEKASTWRTDDSGLVTIFIENRGFMNSVMQKIAKKPRVSQVHLDETGSFIWKLCDGVGNIEGIAGKVREEFGEKSEPLYERLLKFFEVAESYDFIRWEKPVQ